MPTSPPASVCGEYAFVLDMQQWASVEDHAEFPDAIFSLFIGPCEEVVIDGVIEGAILVSAVNVSGQDGLISETAVLASHPDAVPVPETGFATGLVLGIVMLVILASYGREG